MKKFLYIFVLLFLASCTSNTIFKKPDNLIPKDTMSLLIQDMMIAATAKSRKNLNLEKDIHYMSFVYDKYKIDSVRFQESNYYYVSKIDLYQEIFTDVRTQLEKRKEELSASVSKKDSLESILPVMEK